MTTMDQIHRIRELYYEQDKNLNEIAIIMGCDWRTVRKYVDMEDFNITPPVLASTVVHASKLDPFKPLIDGKRLIFSRLASSHFIPHNDRR